MNVNLRAGYQGKHDAMRAKADKLMKNPGSAKDVNKSKSAADNDKVRPYKKGGKVCQKFAAGGVAKIRRGVAAKDGKPTKPKKGSLKGVL